MVKAEVRHQNYQPGQLIEYKVSTLSPDGGVCNYPERSIIQKVSGGGFYGQFLLLKNRSYGIKTTQPTPMHDMLRHFAWGGCEFPSQVLENAAQEDYLATNLISDTLQVVTEGQFYSPGSRGYTFLPTGYSQLIDVVYGRPPKFMPVNEYPKFKQAQEELTAVALNLGLEQVGQIHPDNPFAMANLWYDDARGQFVWLDTLAAFKHEPIFRLLRYKFHEEIRKQFYPDDPSKITYNRIHTDLFRSYVGLFEGEFDPVVYRRVMNNLDLYEQLLANNEEVTARSLKPAIIAAREMAKEVPGKAFDKLRSVLELAGAVFSSDIRKRMVFEGIEEAKEKGLVTEQELTDAETVFNLNEKLKQSALKFRLAEIAMLGYYIASGFGTKGIEGTAYVLNALSDSDPFVKTLMTGGIWLGGQVLSSASRFAGTRVIGGLTGVNLRAAAWVSTIPVFGNGLPFSVQPLVNTGSEDSALWHYSVRRKLAGLSALHPAGGWGTKYEAVLYSKFGPGIESLAVKKKASELSEDEVLEVALVD